MKKTSWFVCWCLSYISVKYDKKKNKIKIIKQLKQNCKKYLAYNENEKKNTY